MADSKIDSKLKVDIDNKSNNSGKWIWYQLTQENNRKLFFRIHNSYDEAVKEFTDDIEQELLPLLRDNETFNEKHLAYIKSCVDNQKFYKCLWARRSHGYFTGILPYNDGVDFDFSDEELNDYPDEFDDYPTSESQ